MRWRLRSALALFSVLAACVGAGSFARHADRAASLERRIEALSETEGFRAARLGVVLLDLDSQRFLVVRDADRAFLPASNLKLFTAALALARLGPAWQASTRLYRLGEIQGGTLLGDLMVRGGGDPALGRGDHPLAPFRAWGERLFQDGLRGVTGDLVVDDGLFEDGPLGAGWAWDDRVAPWSAPFGALSFHGNVIDLHFRPRGLGVAPEVRQQPAIAGVLEVLNLCRVQERGATGLELERRDHPLGAVAKGVLSLSGGPLQRPFPVADPALFAGFALRQALEEAGIRIAGQVRRGGFEPNSTEASLLAERRSPPLSTLIATMLRESDNLYAENLFRLAALEGMRAPGSAAAAGQALGAFLEELGLETEGLVAADGSGLSRLSQVTPRQLVGLLAAAWEQPWGRFLVQSLPRAGREGTLAGRFQGTTAEGVLLAKTGTLTRMAGLSGYRERPGRKPLVFSLLFQGFDCSQEQARAALDRALTWLLGENE